MPIRDVNNLLALPCESLAKYFAPQLQMWLFDLVSKNGQLVSQTPDWDINVRMTPDAVPLDRIVLNHAPGYIEPDSPPATGGDSGAGRSTGPDEMQLIFAVPLKGRESDGFEATVLGRLAGYLHNSNGAKVELIFLDDPGNPQSHSAKLSALRLKGTLTLDTSDPTRYRPRDARAEVKAQLTLEGPMHLKAIGVEANVKGVRVTATSILLFEPALRLDYSLRFAFRTGIFNWIVIPVPSTSHIDVDEQKLPPVVRTTLAEFRSGVLPRTWGEGKPQPAPEPGAVDFDAPACAIETAIRAHTPMADPSLTIPFPCMILFDNVYSEAPGPPRLLHYYGESDTAIWTGHLLAAEAFRYAVANSRAERAAAMEQATCVLSGIRMLFDVPRIASSVTGLPCKSALPFAAATQTRPTFANPETFPSLPPGASTCWNKANQPYTDRGLETYYHDPVMVNGVDMRGFARGDHPPTRDSSTGLMLGLATVFKLMEGTPLQNAAGELAGNHLAYLLDNGWNLPTQTGPLADSQWSIRTTYLHSLLHQVAFLRVGKTIDNARFGNAYRSAIKARDFLWTNLTAESLDPLAHYFKHSLDHGCFLILFLLEDDQNVIPDLRNAFNFLRRTTGHHRNAYFNLVSILADPARADQQSEGATNGTTVRQETRALLAQWLARLNVAGMKGPNGLMRKKTPRPSALTDLYPFNVKPYAEIGSPASDSEMLATFALDVDKRWGSGMDFVWQRDPFHTGLRGDGTLGTEHEEPCIEASGVDYLLPVYLARYLKVI